MCIHVSMCKRNCNVYSMVWYGMIYVDFCSAIVELSPFFLQSRGTIASWNYVVGGGSQQIEISRIALFLKYNW